MFRERYQKTIQHKFADRAPLDLCGTSLSSISDGFLKKMMDYTQMSAEDKESAIEKIQLRYEIDFRHFGSILQPHNPLETKISSQRHTNCWGIEYSYSGMYWEISNNPLKNMTFSEIKEYPWPDASQIDKSVIEAYEKKAKQLFYDTDYVVVAEHPVYGYFELGCWMFGFEDFMLRLAIEPEVVEWFFNNYHKYVLDVIELYYDKVGEYSHLTISGDDFGTQNGPFISPNMFRKSILPWYKKRIRATKELCKGQYFHHSCGSVYRLLDDIIDMGVDILNPIQPGCADMEPQKLKSEYGDKIVFWGGIDEQNLLTHAKPSEVKNEVERIYSIMNHSGGYIMSASHNIQPDVPPENIEVMYKTILQMNA